MVKNELAENLRQYVFEMLDAEPNFSGMEAGQVAHAVEMAFKAVLNNGGGVSGYGPRWNVGDTYQTSGKNSTTAIIVDVNREFTENGHLNYSWKSQHQFLGQTVNNYRVNSTTIARGRFCKQAGRVLESGE